MSEDPIGGGTFNLSAAERKLVVGFADLLTELRSNKRSNKEQEVSHIIVILYTFRLQLH